MVELGANHDGNYFSLVLTDSLMFNVQEFTYKTSAFYKSSGNIQLHFSILSALIIRIDEKTHSVKRTKIYGSGEIYNSYMFIFTWTLLYSQFFSPLNCVVFYYC